MGSVERRGGMLSPLIPARRFSFSHEQEIFLMACGIVHITCHRTALEAGKSSVVSSKLRV